MTVDEIRAAFHVLRTHDGDRGPASREKASKAFYDIAEQVALDVHRIAERLPGLP